MLSRSLRAALGGLVCTFAALAHYTWIAPQPATIEPGKLIAIQIGHGHKFPTSEEAISASQIDLFVVAPSGAKVKLQAAPAGSGVRSQFTPKEAGFHRIAFVQDRGVRSRTPSGVKPGGRDKNPTATQASRTLRTAVSYAGVAAQAPQPLKIEVEMVAALAGGAWNVQLLHHGKPVADTPVAVFLSGAAKPVDVGKTGADGRVRYQPSPGVKGPALFSAEWKGAAPAGATYDFTNFETSLYVSW
jgi:uncharacterized GH25 family protein